MRARRSSSSPVSSPVCGRWPWRAEGAAHGGPSSIDADGSQGMVELCRLRRARGAPDLHRRPRSCGRLHRRSPARVGGEAGGRRRHVLPDRQGGGRPDDEQGVGHRRRQRPDAHLQGRRRDHVPAQHGREADDQRRSDSVRRLRPADAVGQHRRLRRIVDPKGKIDRSISAVRAEDASRQVPDGCSRALAQRRREGSRWRSSVVGAFGFGGRARRRGSPGCSAAQRLRTQAPGAPERSGRSGCGGCSEPAGRSGRCRAQPAAARSQRLARGCGQPDNGDFTTVQRYDRPVAPDRSPRRMSSSSSSSADPT